MFKNLTLFRIQGDWPHTAAELEEILLKHPLVPPAKLAVASRGWLPAGPNGEFVYSTEKQMMICAGLEKKVVPKSTLDREVKAKVEALEQQRGHPVAKKLKREIKEQVMTELLARAMTTLAETRVWIDTMNGYVGVNSSSHKAAEEILSMLRDHCDGTLPVVVLEYDMAPAGVMGNWLTAGKASNGLSIGASAELVSSDENKSKAKFANHEISGNDQVTVHLETGKFVSSMQLETTEASFTLTEKLQIKGIKYVEPEDEGSDGKDDKDAAMAFEGDFRLMTSALQGIVSGLSGALRFKG